MAIIIYLAKIQPLATRYLNAVELINEIILYVCTGLIWGMTDYECEADKLMSQA